VPHSSQELVDAVRLEPLPAVTFGYDALRRPLVDFAEFYVFNFVMCLDALDNLHH
jgi:hypothetical protein